MIVLHLLRFGMEWDKCPHSWRAMSNPKRHERNLGE